MVDYCSPHLPISLLLFGLIPSLLKIAALDEKGSTNYLLTVYFEIILNIQKLQESYKDSHITIHSKLPIFNINPHITLFSIEMIILFWNIWGWNSCTPYSSHFFFNFLWWKNFKYKEKLKELYSQHPYTYHVDSIINTLYLFYHLSIYVFIYYAI